MTSINVCNVIWMLHKEHTQNDFQITPFTQEERDLKNRINEVIHEYVTSMQSSGIDEE